MRVGGSGAQTTRAASRAATLASRVRCACLPCGIDEVSLARLGEREMKPIVGVTGLGIMGSAMANALIEAGCSVVGADVRAA